MPVIVPPTGVTPATGTPIVVPVDLPNPQFVNDSDGLNPTAVLNDMLASFEATTGRTLYPAQVEQLLINIYAYRESLLRNAIQNAGLQNLVAFATYPMLDYLGAFLNTTRLPPQPAGAILVFTLTAPQSSPTTIAAGYNAGTSDGTYVFATTQAVTIPAGATTGQAPALCTSAGPGGNGYNPGQINVPLTVNALILSVSNASTSADGQNEETNNQYRVRIQAAPNRLTTAGPANSYRALALDASAAVIDAQVPQVPTTPGQVNVFVLAGPVTQPATSPNNTGIPNGSILAAVQAALSSATTRPLCDTPVVQPVTEIDYTVTATITLYANANYAAVSAGITTAAQNLALQIASNVQQDIIVSQWVQALSVLGVYQVDLTLSATGGGATFYIDASLPAGLKNGINTVFTLSQTAVDLRLFYNGLLLREGIGEDYTVSGTTATLAFAPISTDVLIAFAFTTGFPGGFNVETPSGTINGSNVTFGTSVAPLTSASVRLYKNGQCLKLGTDFTMAGAAITMTVAPVSTPVLDTLQVFYQTVAVASSTFFDGEVPAGTINNTNPVFTLANTPQPGTSLELYLNGDLLEQSVDYTLSGATITYTTPPRSTPTLDTHQAFYRQSSGITPESDGSYILTTGEWANCTAINLTIVLGTKNQPTS